MLNRFSLRMRAAFSVCCLLFIALLWGHQYWLSRCVLGVRYPVVLSQHFAMKMPWTLEQPVFLINSPVIKQKNIMRHVQMGSVALYPKWLVPIWYVSHGSVSLTIPGRKGKQDVLHQFWHVNSMLETKPVPSQTCFCLVTGINSLPVTWTWKSRIIFNSCPFCHPKFSTPQIWALIPVPGPRQYSYKLELTHTHAFSMHSLHLSPSLAYSKMFNC